MSILKILNFPDEKLRVVAKPVKNINKNVLQIIKDMLETMYHENGIGLAAPQVNIDLQIIVIDISNLQNNPLILINPKILKRSNSFIKLKEGCLSIPQYTESIPRFKDIKVSAIDHQHTYLEIKASNLLSVCIQHEIDHLYGKLFIDYLSPLKRQRIHKKFIKKNRNNIIEKFK